MKARARFEICIEINPGFQAVDKPVVPGSRGLRQYLSGIDDATFQEHRRRLRETSVQDLKRVATAYLSDGKAGVSVMGPEDTAKSLDNSQWHVQNLLGWEKALPKKKTHPM